MCFLAICSYGTQGRNGAVCVIALAEKGALFDPGPCMYMEKLAVGPAVDPNAVSLDRSIAENLQAVAKALQKPIGYASVIAGWQSLVICVNMLSCKCTMCCLLVYITTWQQHWP